MTPAPFRRGPHPSIVLSAYVEPLVRGRRVAILGDSSIGLADELSQRGARLVHVYDPDAARTSEAIARAAPGRPHQVAHAVLAGDLGVRDGAFDVVVVPDLSIFADAAETMRRARKLCAASGVAVLVAPNAGAGGKRLLGAARVAPRANDAAAPLGYYELYDLVSLQFAKVRMIGQAPFVGYTVADFTMRGEPEVSVDTSLLASSEEPEHFIALASDRPVSLDAYAVIELPWSDVAEAMAPGEAIDAGALVEAEGRATKLSVELERLRERMAVDAREAEARAPVAASLSARVAELEGEIATREGKLRETEARAGDNHVRAERLTNQIRDLDEELRRQRDRGTKLSKLLDDEKKARTKAEVELGMLRGTPAAPGTKERIDALTADLAQAQARVSELELEVVETRRRPIAQQPDVSLLARVSELEQALAAAQREAQEAAVQRDVTKREAIEAAVQRDAAQRDAQAAAGQRDTAQHDAQAAAVQRDAAQRDAQAAAVQRDDAQREAHATAVQRDAARRELVEITTQRDTAQRELAEQREAAQRELAEIAAQRDAARREAADAAGQRDAAVERAAKAEGRLERAVTVETVVDSERKETFELAQRARASAEAVVDLERKLLAERERANASAKAAADGVRRLADVEKEAGELGSRASRLARDLAEAEKRAADLEARLAERDQRLADLGDRHAADQARAAAALEDRAAAEAAAAEIVTLERALVERGRAVTALTRDLRESERVGRELLSELEATLGSNGVGGAEELRGRLDALAQSAARGEADLTAATWRIAQLERELAGVSRVAREPAREQIELEAALAAARDEVAALRKALGGSSS